MGSPDLPGLTCTFPPLQAFRFLQDHHLHTSVLPVMVTPELLQEGINCTASNKLGSSVHHFSLEMSTSFCLLLVPAKKRRAQDKLAGTLTSRGNSEVGLQWSPGVTEAVWRNQLGFPLLLKLEGHPGTLPPPGGS